MEGGSITFSTGSGIDSEGNRYDSKEVLRFDPDGKIYVQGRLVKNDPEIIDTFVEYMHCLNNEEVDLNGNKVRQISVIRENKRLRRLIMSLGLD